MYADQNISIEEGLVCKSGTKCRCRPRMKCCGDPSGIQNQGRKITSNEDIERPESLDFSSYECEPRMLLQNTSKKLPCRDACVQPLVDDEQASKHRSIQFEYGGECEINDRCEYCRKPLTLSDLAYENNRESDRRVVEPYFKMDSMQPYSSYGRRYSKLPNNGSSSLTHVPLLSNRQQHDLSIRNPSSELHQYTPEGLNISLDSPCYNTPLQNRETVRNTYPSQHKLQRYGEDFSENNCVVACKEETTNYNTYNCSCNKCTEFISPGRHFYDLKGIPQPPVSTQNQNRRVHNEEHYVEHSKLSDFNHGQNNGTHSIPYYNRYKKISPNLHFDSQESLYQKSNHHKNSHNPRNNRNSDFARNTNEERLDNVREARYKNQRSIALQSNCVWTNSGHQKPNLNENMPREKRESDYGKTNDEYMSNMVARTHLSRKQPIDSHNLHSDSHESVYWKSNPIEENYNSGNKDTDCERNNEDRSSNNLHHIQKELTSNPNFLIGQQEIAYRKSNPRTIPNAKNREFDSEKTNYEDRVNTGIRQMKKEPITSPNFQVDLREITYQKSNPNSIYSTRNNKESDYGSVGKSSKVYGTRSRQKQYSPLAFSHLNFADKQSRMSTSYSKNIDAKLEINRKSLISNEAVKETSYKRPVQTVTTRVTADENCLEGAKEIVHWQNEFHLDHENCNEIRGQKQKVKEVLSETLKRIENGLNIRLDEPATTEDSLSFVKTSQFERPCTVIILNVKGDTNQVPDINENQLYSYTDQSDSNCMVLKDVDKNQPSITINNKSGVTSDKSKTSNKKLHPKCYRKPEVWEQVYKTSDLVLKELEETLKQIGRWNME